MAKTILLWTFKTFSLFLCLILELLQILFKYLSINILGSNYSSLNFKSFSLFLCLILEFSCINSILGLFGSVNLPVFVVISFCTLLRWKRLEVNTLFIFFLPCYLTLFPLFPFPNYLTTFTFVCMIQYDNLNKWMEKAIE